MKKFFLLMSLIGKTQVVTGKPIDDLQWDDLFVLFADEEWVALFDQVYKAF
jgi:aspartate/tyrosine/aromatic aminotransferase